MKHKLLLLITVLLTAVPYIAPAQQSMIVQHYTQEEGLPSNIVYSSLQDKDGFVWFGTWHGLCSFDGITFTPYLNRTNLFSDFPPRKVRDMLEDSDGRIWICNTDNHLFVFDKAAETYHDVYPELKRKARNVQVIKIQLMHNGHILALTRNKDLFEIYVRKDGKTAVNTVCDSHSEVDPATLRLRRNVVGENKNYIYWLSKEFEVDVIAKKTEAKVLPSTDSRFTCFSRKDQYLCVGTEHGGIYIIRYDAGKRPSCRSFNGINAPVTSINIIDGKVLFTSGGRLWTMPKDNKPVQAAAVSGTVTKSFTDSGHRLWLCTDNGRLVSFDTRTNLSQTFALPTTNIFTSLKFADAGQNGLFILTQNGEVWRYDYRNRTMQNINRTTEFRTFVSDPHYYDINIDQNGVMWLASTGGGVYKVGFPKDCFHLQFADFLHNENSNDNDGIRAVYQDKQGDLWIGTRHGELYCMDIRTMTVKRRFSKTDIGVVYHIMEDKAGRYWFSTKGSGLVMAIHDILAPQGLRLTRYTASQTDRNTISSNRIYYTFEDSRGRIWACTFNGGLNLIEQRGGKTIFISRRNGFKHYPKYELYSYVRIIAEDKNGRFWVGTTDGLMSFSGNFTRPQDILFETYREHTNVGITGNDIFSIFKDHAGRIWMGVFGNGLNRLESYDEQKHMPVLRHYPISGNSGDVITSISEDQSNCLWICTENSLASLCEGSNLVKSYDMFAGLPSVNIEDNTSTCLSDGRIVIGTRQGLLSLNPSAVRNANARRYFTFITAFKVANRNLCDFDPPSYSGSLKYAGKITLEHNHSTFTIEFSSPYYAGNTLLQYSYILDGYEKEWHNSGENRIASYANVPPGKYKFRVKVNDGVSPERILKVVITPPWWATWWAYAVYSALFLLALYGAIRLVLYMIRMRNEVYINDKLAELKIRFFTNVSHELRTPLSLIKGPIDELKANERLSASGKEYLELIDRNASKMLQLVNQILDFRKVQNGKMKMHVSLTDMNAVIGLFMREFLVLADERHIKFTASIPETKVMAWCDAEKIGVAVNNLLSNAFKYTDDGGSVNVALSYAPDNQACRITVEDDGADIPKSQLESIFERFSQASNKTSENSTSSGTGIGLALSREFINMHHGRIWAENRTEGKGVIFSIEFPTGREKFDSAEYDVYFDDDTAGSSTTSELETQAESSVNTSQDDNDSDRPAVMLIEDNIDMCRMLYLQLRTKYNVFTAHNGEDGLKGIYEHHPDIIITDLMMPGIDGMELLRRIRQDFNISHIPVIILTAKNTDEDKMDAVKAGANAYITKPFSSVYLMARVKQLLDEQRIFQRKMVIQTTMENQQESNGDDYGSHLVKKDIEFVQKIHSIIEDNLNSNDFNIDTIAETIGLSRSAFFKKLKSLTGFAPVDLVREIRLNKAVKLIESTDNSIAEIAYSVGFRDAGYFGKCFRKKFGMTPKEYRTDKKGTSASENA